MKKGPPRSCRRPSPSWVLVRAVVQEPHDHTPNAFIRLAETCPVDTADECGHRLPSVRMRAALENARVFPTCLPSGLEALLSPQV